MRRLNVVAAYTIDRLCTLSDALFAIAMTLLILELRPPAPEHIAVDSDLQAALTALLPRFVACIMGFMTLGIFWIAQKTQLHHLRDADRQAVWLHLVFLMGVSFMPFSTGMVAEYMMFKTATFIYLVNVFFLGAMLYAAWLYARRTQLVTESVDALFDEAVKRRIIITQAGYALPALLAFINPYYAVVGIVLLQFAYALAPPFARIRRLQPAKR